MPWDNLLEMEAIEAALKQKISRWGWISRIPVHHLSFILRQCLPLHRISRSEVERNKKRIAKGTLSIFQNDLGFEALQSGSSIEGLSLPSCVNVRQLTSGAKLTAFDLDVMVVAKKFIVANEGGGSTKNVHFYIESDATYPGYLRLRYADPKAPPTRYKATKGGTGDVYMTTSINDDILQTLGGYSGLASSQRVSVRGPALTLKDDNKLKTLVLDTDCVHCFPCPDWPSEASEWINRPRPSGWPSIDLRNRIIASGCHVVPVSHPQSKYRAIEWRFSFSNGEGLLAESLTDIQRQCYILLKMIHHMHLKAPKVLVSYHLKNICFSVCEMVPLEQWREDNVGGCFLIILDELLHCLLNHNIPNYFMPANNMISHVHREFVHEIARKVSQIRHDPVKYLFEFQNTYKFEFSPMAMSMDYFFDEVFQDIDKGATDMYDTVEKAFIPSLIKIGSEHARENRIIDAVEIFSQIPNLKTQYRMPAPDLVPLLGSFIQFVPESQKINYLEQVASKYPGDKKNARLLSNLGCYIFACALSKSDKHDRKLLELKAQSYFKKAAVMANYSAADKVDFAIFLCRTKKTESAISYLKQAIQEEKNNMMSSNGYDRYEIAILDEHLQAEVDAAGHFHVPSLIMAYYLLVKCLQKKSQNTEPTTETTAQVLRRFKIACANVKDVLKKTFSLSLLGYALMDSQEYERAAKSFAEAVELKPDYRLAAENVILANWKGGRKCFKLDTKPTA